MEYFGANKIIKQHICQNNLCTYFVGFDLDDNGNSHYRINELIKLLIRVIPEFAFGHHLGQVTSNTEIVNTLCDAAKAVYSIDVFQKVRDIYLSGNSIDDFVADKYLKRGEFGELILHLLLRDYKDTIPLISKIYFRDSECRQSRHSVKFMTCVINFSCWKERNRAFSHKLFHNLNALFPGSPYMPLSLIQMENSSFSIPFSYIQSITIILCLQSESLKYILEIL